MPKGDPIIRAAALHLLRRGDASLAELAELAQRGRQTVHWWAESVPGAREARAERLAKLWADAIAKARREA